MTFDVFSRNGEILPAAQASIPLANIEYAYGFGVYETIRVAHGKPRFLPDHAHRLMHSARIIGLEHPFIQEKVSDWIEALVALLGDDVTCNLKVMLIGAREPAHCQLIVLPLAPLFPDKRLYAHGATAITFPYERLFPQAKTLNMFGSYMAYRKAKQAGCYDALLVDRRGCITEGTRTNFFCIRGTALFSPPREDVLEGVTRKHVLEVAAENGFTLEEDEIPLASLPEYDGAFLTSTSSKIMPLKQIDAHVFPKTPTDDLRELMARYDDFVASA